MSAPLFRRTSRKPWWAGWWALWSNGAVMPLLVNLRRLEKHDVRLRGQMSAAELDMESVDELIRVRSPLNYDLEVQKIDNGLLARGRLELTLQCECVRCLQPLQHRLDLPDWTAPLP